MIGCSVSTVGGLIVGILRAKEHGLDCTQIYSMKSRRWDVSFLNETDVNLIKQYKKENKIELVVHIPFLVNLASPDEQIWEKSLDRLRIEIDCAYKLEINYIVLHPGSYIHDNIDMGIEGIANGLNAVGEICKEKNIRILLETMSGQGTQIGSSFEQLASILSRTFYQDEICFCFDTAHVFSAGYDISTNEKFEVTLSHFFKILGKDKLKVFHLNNTKTKLGMKSDRHSSIFDGEIKLEVFEKIVSDKRFSEVLKIIEPSANDRSGFDQVRHLKQSAGEI